VLQGFASLLILLMLAIVTQVVCSALDINPLLRFSEPVFLFGAAVSLNSLLDLQWHLLAAIAFLLAGVVWLRDAHVRVDFFYAARSARTKALIDLLGHFLFTATFLFLSIPASWSFLQRAWTSDQGSINDGLVDLWFIKSVLPLGLTLLAVVLIVDSVRLIQLLRGKQ
jgi:TRAP-type mannitol/chloroaromatic compound transport system permease small subunit